MCNLNQVFRGMHRYHYSCYRRRMHQIVAAPCCPSGQNRTTKESIPAVEKTSSGKQLPRKSSSSSAKTPDSSTANPLPKKVPPTTSQRKNNNKSSDSSVSSINKKLSKGKPVPTNKISVDKSAKMGRLSGGSVEIKKNKKSCVCNICEEDSGCSSDGDYGSPMSILSPKSTRNGTKIKPSKSKSVPQDTDCKALVKSKPKRKKIVQRRSPSRSPIRAVECPKAKQINDDDGVWFECNLPFRVNIPFPINIRNLFDLQSFQNNAIVPARNCGNPFCLTMRNSMPVPVHPTSVKKGLRRFKAHPSPCSCETCTQTGEEECELLRCLYDIKNQLAAKSTECRCFAEKSTYVRAPDKEGSIRLKEKPAKVSKVSSAISNETFVSNVCLRELRTPTCKSKKTEKKPKKLPQITSTTSLKRNNSSKTNETEKKPKKTQPVTSDNACSSMCSLNKVPKATAKTKMAEQKPEKTKSIASITSSSRCVSLTEVQKPPIKTHKSVEKSIKHKSITSTERLTKKCSSKCSQEVEKSSQDKLEQKDDKGPHIKKPIIVTKPRETVESINVKDTEKNRESLKPECKVEINQIKPEVENNISLQIQREREWIDPNPSITWTVPRVFPNEFAKCLRSQYQPRCMYRGCKARNPLMYQALQYPGHCSQQFWPNCQRNPYLMNNTVYQSVSLPTATCATSNPCKPLVEEKKFEKIEPVRKISVCFCPSPQVFPECTASITQGSQCQPNCVYQRGTPEHKSTMTQGTQCQPICMYQKGTPEYKSTMTQGSQCPSNGMYQRETPERNCTMTQGSQCPSNGMYQRGTPERNSTMTQGSQCQSYGMCQRGTHGYKSTMTQGTQCPSNRTPEYKSIMIQGPQCRFNGMYQREALERNSTVTQGSHCQSSCMYPRWTPGYCYQRCGPNWQTQKPAIPITSSSEYNKRALLKKSLCRNASPKESSIICPCSPGVQGNNSVNCKPSAKSTCFKICPSQPKICNRTGHTNSGYVECVSWNRSNTASSCCRKAQNVPSDRISSGGETTRINSNFDSISQELSSVSQIAQEYYFPLDDKKQRSIKSLNLQEKANVSKNITANIIPGQVDRCQEDRSHEKVLEINKEVCCSEKPTGETQIKCNISYNQDKSRNDISEDQIIVSFTNQSFSVDSEEFNRTDSEEKPQLSQKRPNYVKTNDNLTLQYSERTFPNEYTRSIRTNQVDDIDEYQSTSSERLHLSQVSENKTNIPCNSIERNPESIQYTRHESGMTKRLNNSDKQAENCQKSPTINTNKKQRSRSAPGCCGASLDGNNENKSETPVIYRQCFSLRNQIPKKFYNLTKGSDNNQDESCNTEMEQAGQLPTERTRENSKPEDKGTCKCPDYSIKANMRKAKQIGEKGCCIPRQDQKRTSNAPGNMPVHQNIPSRSPRNVERHKADYQDSSFRTKPPMPSSKKYKMESDETYQVSEMRRQTREPPFQERSSSSYLQSTGCQRTGNQKHKDIPKSKISKPQTSTDFSLSEEEDHPSSLSHTRKDQNYCQSNQRDISYKKESKIKTRLRKSCSQDSLSQSEDGYYSRTCKCLPKTYHDTPYSTSASSSPYSPSTKSSISVESREKSSRSVSYNYKPKENRKVYPGYRNKPCCVHGNNSELIKENSESESEESLLLTSTEESEDCRCKPNNSHSKSIQSGRTTDVEILETLTLLQPPHLRSTESTRIFNSKICSEDTVLLEIRTTCKKDSLLQTCARPPCKFRREHKAEIPPTAVPVQSPNYYPRNGNFFEETYLIDPRDHWNTIRSQAVPPALYCQQQLQMQNLDPRYPAYHPQQVKEAIEALPLGFYDQTIHQYNIIRMDSNFRPPTLGPEIIQAVQAFPQSHCGCPPCPYRNPMQQQIMRPVRDFTRPFIQPQNLIQHQLPMRPTQFCSQQPR
ncbi:uncharacterized protein LOC110177469 isoform X1 [Drosophila serrata]|uniref:uncharacterized protein LOC110177469 isoform X1 n=1 Tax=Drosophila serrata TaxID=7274 RepID=UPI000A1D0101|nr:uncharacterized protein LOC110177469 isoform X1 [Drosophila serrata]